jgi:hypothetical protein
MAAHNQLLEQLVHCALLGVTVAAVSALSICWCSLESGVAASGGGCAGCLSTYTVDREMRLLMQPLCGVVQAVIAPIIGSGV